MSPPFAFACSPSASSGSIFTDRRPVPTCAQCQCTVVVGLGPVRATYVVVAGLRVLCGFASAACPPTACAIVCAHLLRFLVRGLVCGLSCCSCVIVSLHFCSLSSIIVVLVCLSSLCLLGCSSRLAALFAVWASLFQRFVGLRLLGQLRVLELAVLAAGAMPLGLDSSTDDQPALLSAHFTHGRSIQNTAACSLYRSHGKSTASTPPNTYILSSPSHVAHESATAAASTSQIQAQMTSQRDVQLVAGLVAAARVFVTSPMNALQVT